MVEATLRLPLAVDQKKAAVNISEASIVTASKDLLFCELSDGAVILALKSGVYYGLDAVGTRIWSLIQQPRSMHAILAVLIEEYDVDAERCGQDLREILQEMLSLDLIEVQDETAY